MYSVIISKLETNRQNIIQFKKDLWQQDCKVLMHKENVFQHTFQNYTNLEDLTLSGYIGIEENSFDNLKNLTRLKLRIYSGVIPEFLFKNLNKLKELSIHKGGLNKDHMHGLDNLESLELFDSFDGQIENLLNLKKLTLKSFHFKEFSFKYFKNLETLSVEIFDFDRKTPKKIFSYLTSLKNLTFYDYRRRDDKYSSCLIKELFSNLSSNVVNFECKYFIFDILHSYKTPFIYNLKSLVITIESEIDFMNYFLFHENLFPSLESIDLRRIASSRQGISVELFKRIKKLKILKLQGYSLFGIDKEFNNLEEASFDFQIPENVSNFSNLKKLNLKNLTRKIVLEENFLEDLINLEELVLDDVVDSIDSNAQYLFKKLIKLKELKLTGVYFKNLKSTYFDYLVSLEKLDLQDSFFRNVEEKPFRNLKRLNYLNLSNCRADKPFDRSFFVGILTLNTLDMKFDSDILSTENIESKSDFLSRSKHLKLENHGNKSIMKAGPHFDYDSE